MFCVRVRSLSKIHCVFFTNLNLIKLMFVSCGVALGSLLCMFFGRCLMVPLEEKRLQLMFHHPPFQNRLDVHLKTQTVKNSRLLLIRKHTPAFFRKLLLWWNEWSNLTPWELNLFLGYLKLKIRLIYSGTLRTRLMN